MLRIKNIMEDYRIIEVVKEEQLELNTEEKLKIQY